MKSGSGCAFEGLIFLGVLGLVATIILLGISVGHKGAEYIAPVYKVDYYRNRIIVDCPSDSHNPAPWIGVSEPLMLLLEPGQRIRYKKDVNLFGMVIDRHVVEVMDE